MADIELVIKLPQEKYNMIKRNMYCGIYDANLYNAIANGTPLPKGHGRLIDADELEKYMVNGIKSGLYEEGYEIFEHINDMDDCVECVKYAPTIIEADKIESEDKE